MKYNRKTLLITTILFLFMFTLEGFAQDVKSDQKVLNQLNQKIKNATTQLVTNKKKEQSVASQIKVLEQKISRTEEEIGEIGKQITLTKKQIDVTRAELKNAESNIGDRKEVLNSRLRVMYKNGNVGYAEVLLNSANIIDLFSKMDMIKRIVNHDTDMLKDMKDQRDSIETKKRTLEAHESRLVKMMATVEEKQKDLEQSRGQLSRIKEKLHKDNEELEKQIDAMNKEAEKLAAVIRKKQSKGEYVGGKLGWPAPGYTNITSPYGYRIHPILKQRKLHTGIDVGVPTGKDIVAAGDGTVIHSDWLGGYGKTIMIDHGGGIVTLYAHNSSLVASDGDKVKKGETVAKSGSTGMSTGPHLHFEVRKNGDYVDPIPWLKK